MLLILLTKQNELSEEDYIEKAIGVVGKGVLGKALVCTGPIGWAGLAGLSIASTFERASNQGKVQNQQPT